jgi:hypothetical protein
LNTDQILVAVPTRGLVSWGTCTRLQEIRDAHPGLLSVASTRNAIVRRFMDGDWLALVMVDDDVVPASNLLGLCDSLEVWDVVAMPTFVWRPDIATSPVVAAFGLTQLIVSGGVREAEQVGTGCVAVHRRVFEALHDNPFAVGFEGGRDVSDDIMFCRAVRTAGFRIGADFTSAADHHTTVSLQSLVMAERARANA